MTAWPAPPWHTFGDAVMVPVPVDLGALRPPPGLTLERPSGPGLGLLGVVRYRPPSPLTYHELFWLPARVRDAGDAGGARGWWVAKMLVDDATSLAAGRALWALPKQLATFLGDVDDVTVRAGDGAVLRVRASRGVPLGRHGGSVVTLSRDAAGLVRFRGDLAGSVRLGRARVEARGLDGTWQGLRGLAATARPAIRLGDFEGWMRPPKR